MMLTKCVDHDQSAQIYLSENLGSLQYYLYDWKRFPVSHASLPLQSPMRGPLTLVSKPESSGLGLLYNL